MDLLYLPAVDDVRKIAQMVRLSCPMFSFWLVNIAVPAAIYIHSTRTKALLDLWLLFAVQARASAGANRPRSYHRTCLNQL